MNQSLLYIEQKTGFARIILSYVIAAAASEPEASEQGSRPNLYVYVLLLRSERD